MSDPLIERATKWLRDNSTEDDSICTCSDCFCLPELAKSLAAEFSAHDADLRNRVLGEARKKLWGVIAETKVPLVQLDPGWLAGRIDFEILALRTGEPPKEPSSSATPPRVTVEMIEAVKDLNDPAEVALALNQMLAASQQTPVVVCEEVCP